MALSGLQPTGIFWIFVHQDEVRGFWGRYNRKP